MPKKTTLNIDYVDDSAYVEMADVASRSSLGVFTEHILGFDNAPHHLDWYSVLENRLTTPKEGDWESPLVECDPETHKNNLIMLFAPRSHAKSTCITVNYTLHEIGKNPNLRILIVSSTSTLSEAFLREIKGQMTQNVKYRRVFGDLFPAEIIEADKWTNSEIIVRRTNTKLKDPTVATASAGGTILGRRADIIICDDILNEKNTKTAEQRLKIKEWFESVLMPVLEPDGRLIVVGTAWNKEDLYHQIVKNPIYDVRKRYKAIINDVTRETLWEARWSYDKLMERKEQVGSMSFNKSYQNEASSAEDAVFQAEWLEEAKFKGKTRKLLMNFRYDIWDLGQLTIAGGVDLAISQKDDSDYTAMAVVGQTREGMKIPLYLLREKLSPAQTKAKIISLNERFNPDVIMVENNAYQEALRRDLADSTSVPVKGYTTGGEKYDIDIGVNSLAVDFENGKWILPYSNEDPYTQQMIDILVGGMLDFPGGHTEDLLMALWFANNGLRTLTAKASSVSSGRASDIFGR